MTVGQLLAALGEGKIARRLNVTGTWYLDDPKPVTRAVKTLIKRGLVWEHYPVGGGHVGINDAGRAALAKGRVR